MLLLQTIYKELLILEFEMKFEYEQSFEVQLHTLILQK